MDGSDKVKQREMTERWAAKNYREYTERKQLTDTDRQTQVGATLWSHSDGQRLHKDMSWAEQDLFTEGTEDDALKHVYQLTVWLSSLVSVTLTHSKRL